MKILERNGLFFVLVCLAATSSLLVAQNPGNSFVNGNFETGDIQGWTLGGGDRSSVLNSGLSPDMLLPGGNLYNPGIAASNSSIVTPGLDSDTGSNLNGVYSGAYSFRVEDLNAGGYASVISQRVNNYTASEIFFAWAAVLEGAHGREDAATVKIYLRDLTTGETLISREYNAADDGTGVDQRFSYDESTNHYWTQWQIENITLPTDRIGHDFELSILAADCQPTAHKGYVYVDAFGGAPPRIESLVLNVRSLIFNYKPGDPAPDPRTLTVTSSGDPLLVSARVNPATPAPWLSVAMIPPGTTEIELFTTVQDPPTETETELSVPTPAQIVVTAMPEQLSPGTYTAQVLIESPGAANSPFSVPVTLIVGATAPEVSPASLTFTSENRRIPPAQTLTFSSPSTVDIEIVTPAGGNWLTVAYVPPGTNGTMATVAINPAGITALAFGRYSATIRVNREEGAAVSVPVTLNLFESQYVPSFPPVQIPPSAVCPAAPLVVGESYAAGLGALGGGAYVDFNIAGRLPPGLSIAGNRVFGTPNTVGTFSYVVEAASPPYSAQTTCTVTVVPGPLRIASGCPEVPARQGTWYAFPVIPAGGSGAGTYTYSAIGLPAGLSLSNARVTGVPAAEPGSYTATLQVGSGDQTVTLECPFTISEPDGGGLRLSAQCPTEPSAAGELITLSASASGGDSSGYVFSLSGPDWLSLNAEAGAATVSGTAPEPGNYALTITVTDGAGDSRSFSCTLQVGAARLDITANPGCPSEPVQRPAGLSVGLSASAGTAPYSWQMQGPAWLSLSAAEGSSVTVSGVPGSPGEHSFSVTLRDTEATATYTCSFTVAPIEPPSVEITGLTASLNASQSGQLELRLSAPAPADLRGELVLTFVPDVPLAGVADNPWVQFGPLSPPDSTGPIVIERRSIRALIPFGQQTIPLGAAVALSNVAGTVRVQLTSLKDGEIELLEQRPEPAEFRISRQAPVISNVAINQGGLAIEGHSNTLDMQSITLAFTPASDATIEGSNTFTFTDEIRTAFQQFYSQRFTGGSDAGAAAGSAFQLRFPLTIENAEAIGSVTVTLVNSAGSTQSGPHPLR